MDTDKEQQPNIPQDQHLDAPPPNPSPLNQTSPPPHQTTHVDPLHQQQGLPESDPTTPPPPPLSSQPQEEEEKHQHPLQEPSPSLPPPDLPKVSQEIDHYITLLLSSLNPDDSSSSSLPDTTVPICVEQFALLFDAKIDEYDSVDSPVKWTRLTDEDSESFLDAVHRISRLHSALSHFSSDYQYSYSINHTGSVLQRAMSYLEEEFRSLMEDYKIPDSDYHDSPGLEEKVNEVDETEEKNSVSEKKDDDDDHHHPPATPDQEGKTIDVSRPEIGYSDEGLSNLRKLSNAMIREGYETECCQVYFVTRRNVLEETLHRFGSEKHSIDDVVQKMNWEPLEREIMAWIKTFKLCANSEFPRERKLSDFIFQDYPQVSESIFSTLTRGIIVELVNFSEAVAMTKRAAEKLFKFLDIYETLRDVLPTVDSLFPKESVSLEEIKSEATLTRSRLGEAMVSIFCELENSIKADTGKTPVPGGAVHPLTRYTINYLKYACEYKDTLEQVFREHQKIERSDSAVRSDIDYNSSGSTGGVENNNSNNTDQKIQLSPYQCRLMKVMELLDQNLETKSKLYKDLSLSSIFMMNNGRYILQKVRGSPEVSSLMGDAWCRKRSSDLRQYHKNYQRETWGKLLNCLINHEGLSVNGKVVKPVLKERLKSFNAMFEEIHKTQSGWVVSDEQLQSELRVSISNMVIPAYRAFLARYGQTLTPGRQTEKYVKHQPEEIEELVDELFDGNTANPIGRRKL